MLRLQWDSFLKKNPKNNKTDEKTTPHSHPDSVLGFCRSLLVLETRDAFQFLRDLFAVVAAGPVHLWLNAVPCSQKELCSDGELYCPEEGNVYVQGPVSCTEV